MGSRTSFIGRFCTALSLGVLAVTLATCKPPAAGAEPEASCTPRFLLWMRPAGANPHDGHALRYFDIPVQMAVNLGRPIEGLDYGLVMQAGRRLTPVFRCGDACAPCQPGPDERGIDCPPEPPIPCPKTNFTICPREPGPGFLERASHHPEWPRSPDDERR